MFGLFAPTCPLGTWEKTWTERRMLWLADKFGLDRLKSARVVLPTDEFFPDRYDADTPSARRCFDRVCGYMGVDPASLHMNVVPDAMLPDAAGMYGERERTIWIAASQLTDPARLIAVIAHELAHELLIRGGCLPWDGDGNAAARAVVRRGGRLSPDMNDHEEVTDLLPVFLGTGVFLANATIVSRSGYEGGWSWWSVGRSGYLSSFVLGYGLALFAFARGETKPAWAKYLRPDARGTMLSALRYLTRTGDTLFTPDAAAAGPRLATVPVLVERMGHASATRRLSALWDVTEQPRDKPEVLAAIRRCLDDRDEAVLAAAALAAAALGDAADEAVPRVVELTEWDAPEVRSAAVRALGRLRTRADEAVPALVARLTDKHPDVGSAAAEALAAYRFAARPAVPKVLEALERALVKGDLRVSSLVGVLMVLDPDPEARLRDHFRRDEDQMRSALMVLREFAE